MTILLFLPGSKLPETNEWNFLMLDKIAHFGLFLFFAFFLWRGFNKQTQNIILKRNALTFSALIGIGYAISAEFLQQLTSDRNFEWQDIVANLLGCLVGLLLYRLFYKN